MNKKNIAFLKEENLLTLFSQNNFIVPEIQREYVWGNNENVIIGFLKDLKNKIGKSCDCCKLPTSNDRINIGFLYSYKPDYVTIKHERFLDENIIDGQQRFTTLFLLLFFCALKEKRKKDFLTLIRFEKKISMCLNFKVRDLTRKFLLEFVEKTNEINQVRFIDQQTWFLKDYQTDTSIKAMRKALQFIENEFSDDIKYYNHFLNNIVFWHFKTEVTNQGEELYITMNARGEELSKNEITKASLMLDKNELFEFGKKWENWQHVFWKNRFKNKSADKGFNSFLNCIAGLENYHRIFDDNFSIPEIKELLATETIEKYIKAFKFLLNRKVVFIEKHKENNNYVEWVDKCVTEIWSLFNNSNNNWLADFNDKNRSTERRRMVFIWSWLYYITEMWSQDKKISDNELFRVLRIFYLRYNNNDRRVKKVLKNTVEMFIANGVLNSVNIEDDIDEDVEDVQNDEGLKRIYFNKLSETSAEELNKIESLIWEIEDHPLNLNATDLGGVNISHLVDLTRNPKEQDFEDVLFNFNLLFPNGTSKDSGMLKSTLLFIGKFWRDKSLSYYSRYDFSEWRKHIRTPMFKSLFNKLKASELYLKDFLEEYEKEFLLKNKDLILNADKLLPEMNFEKQLCFYNILLNSQIMWSQGELIIIRYELDDKRLFINENQKIYNSKGNFKGNSGNIDLWEEVLKIHKNPLKALKNMVNNL